MGPMDTPKEGLPKTVIIGAGPAGLTAAYVLADRGCSALVLEREDQVGGLAKTLCYKNFCFDVGGHRFFTKIGAVKDLWRKILGDDFLRVRRVSRIYYRGKFFDYPLKAWNAFSLLGPVESLLVILSYLKSQIRPFRDEATFDQYVTNRFGKRLYTMFFKAYTEKVWGIPCTEIGSEWAAQRIKGLSLATAMRHAIFGSFGTRVKSLIEEFDYPLLGPGYLWEKVAADVERRGSAIRLNSRVVRICHDGTFVRELWYESGGRCSAHPVDYLLSSMPLRTFLCSMYPPPPGEVLRAAAGLRYRDLVVVNLIANRARVFPDNWIYVHAPEARVGRIQNYKNWSDAMVPDPNRTSLGLEYYCSESDELWNSDDDGLIELGKRDLELLGLLRPEEVVDGFVYRQKKAYPIYDRNSTESIHGVRKYLERFENLAMIGRNGMHKYNNQDHSMLTAMLAVENMFGRSHDLWSINADSEYQETA